MIQDPTENPHEAIHLKAHSLLHESTDEGAFKEVVQLLAEHLKEHGDDVLGYCLLSEALLAEGKADESLEAALEAMKIAENTDAHPPYRAGMALFDLAALADGVALEDGIQLDPIIHFIEGFLEIPPLMEPRLAEQALEMFEEAQQRDPEGIGHLFWAGICQLNMGRKDEALESFERGLEQSSDEKMAADHLFLAGLVCEDLSDREEAKARYTKALDLVPDHDGSKIRLEWINPEDRKNFLSDEEAEDLLDHIAGKLTEQVEITLTEENIEPRPEPPYDLAFLASVCSGTLIHSIEWAQENNIDGEKLESFLAYHGAISDCEVLYNLEAQMNPDEGFEC